MLGAALGGITGGIQLYLLILVAASVEQCNIKIWPLVVQFFCPIVGLGLCAILWRRQILYCAIGMSGVLLVGALVKFIGVRRRKKDVE